MEPGIHYSGRAMLNFMRLVFFAAISLILCACHSVDRDDLYAYYLRHPLELKEAVEECRAEKDAASHCAIALKAMDEMSALLKEQRQDPQKFGEDILREEMAYSKTHDPEIQDKIRVLLAVVSLSSPE
jgi:hypothetical protein